MKKHLSRYVFLILLLTIIPFLQPAYSTNETLQNAAALYEKALELNRQNRIPEAISLIKEVLTIWKSHKGPEHPDVMAALNNLSELYRVLGNYEEAKNFGQRALTLSKKIMRPEHPAAAAIMNNLAVIDIHLGQYQDALALLKKVLAIREKAFGRDHPAVGQVLNNMAAAYLRLGNYAQAEALNKKALKISEEAYGHAHRDVVMNLHNLAEVYRETGDYDKALTLYTKSATIIEDLYGKDHPDSSAIFNSMALTYQDLGDYTQAERLYEKAILIKEKTGSDSPGLATYFQNFGQLYEARQEYDKAEHLYRRALAIKKKAFGIEHPAVALALGDLAGIFYYHKDYAAAEKLLQESLRIHKKTLGSWNPRVALDLNNLAELYSTMGDDAKAVSLLKRSLAIIEKTKGPWHPDVAINLNNLALDLARMGDYQNAHDFNMQAQRIDTKLIEQVMGFTSERQKINFLSTTFGKLYSFISLVRFYLDQSTSAVKDAFDIWIKRKGVILESQRRFQEALIYSEDPGAIQTFQELSKARAALSKLAFMGPGNEKIESYTARIDKLDKKINNLEVQLSQLSERFARQNRMAQADSEELARSLPENSALIEFAKIEMFNFNIREIGKRWDPAHYLVFILNARKANQIQLIDLGNAEAIDRMVNKLRNEISRYKNLKNIKTMTSTGELYKKVFLPIKKKLGDAKEVFVSPDGNLNLIPFEILQGPNGRFLIEDYTFNYLSAARDLLGFGKIGEKGHKALFIGDPDFDLKAKEKSSYLRQLGLEEEKKNTIAQRAKDMRGIYFARLPGTREEVAAICALLGEDKAALYTGKQALEEVLRQKQTPSILHIATHGFFLKDLSYGVSVNEEAIRGIQGIPQSIKSKGARLKITNPLLRSGLALAGANYALRYGDLGFNDGILTAEKILGLKLFGTEMVVLSACETGVGDVKMGEGVYGLRRALTQAGAKSLVMSLWSVPDRETKELMIQFYKNIQSAQMNRCQALRHAALRQIKIVKNRYGHSHPIFWGGFVFLGEP